MKFWSTSFKFVAFALTLPLLAAGCSSSTPSHTLGSTGQNKSKPIDEGLGKPDTATNRQALAVSTLDLKNEIVVYYANETTLDATALANRSQFITALVGTQLPAAIKVAEHLRDDPVNFPAAVNADVTQLELSLCSSARNVALYVFTNSDYKAGHYRYCKAGDKSLAARELASGAVEAAINNVPNPAQAWYRNAPLAHPSALRLALQIAGQDQNILQPVFSLITKSHGNAKTALGVPLQRSFDQLWFDQYLRTVLAAAAPKVATTSASLALNDSAGGGNGLSDSGNGLSDAGNGLSDAGNGLGDYAGKLGTAAEGISKDEYVKIIDENNAKHFGILFLEACETYLSPSEKQDLANGHFDTGVWTSDADGLEYKTIADYGKIGIGPSESFAKALDAALKQVVAATTTMALN